MPPLARYLLRRALVLGLLVLAACAASTYVTSRPVADAGMLPTLWPGDRLLVTRYRAGASPARGDVVVVATSQGERIGRVIGLPGDRIAIRRGSAVMNSEALPRYRVADLVLPVSPNLRCPVARQAGACRLQRYRETAPDGRAWDVLSGTAARAAVTVPKQRLFLLADDRAAPLVGLVAIAAVRGRATTILWSADGTATWERFWRWGETLRPSRIMKGVERTPAPG